MSDYKKRLSSAFSEASEYIKEFDAKCRETAGHRLEGNALYKAPSAGGFVWVVFELAVVFCLYYFKETIYQFLSYKLKIGVLRDFFEPVLFGCCVLIVICAVVSLGRMIFSVFSARKVSHIRKIGDDLLGEMRTSDGFTRALYEAIEQKKDMQIDLAPSQEKRLGAYQNEAVSADAGSARIKKWALTIFWPVVLLFCLAFFYGSITENLLWQPSFLRGNTVMLSYVFLFFILVETVIHLAPYYGKKVKVIVMILFALFQCGVTYFLYQHGRFEPLVDAYHMYAADIAIPEKLQIPYGILRGFVLDYLFLVLFFTTLLILLMLKNLDGEVWALRLKEGVELPMQNSADVIKSAAQVRWILISRCGAAMLLSQFAARFAADAFVNTTGEVVTTMQTVTLLVICILWRIMASFLNSDLMKAVFGKSFTPCLKYALLTVFVLLTLSVRPVTIIWPYAVFTVYYLFML